MVHIRASLLVFQSEGNLHLWSTINSTFIFIWSSCAPFHVILIYSGRDNLACIAQPQFVTCNSGSQAVTNSSHLCFYPEKHTSVHLLAKVVSSHYVNISATALSIYTSAAFSLLLLFSSAIPITHPPQVFPIAISVQRQGTGSRPRLNFHTVLFTERHIKLIRVNKCGGTPISLARQCSSHTDGLA